MKTKLTTLSLILLFILLLPVQAQEGSSKNSKIIDTDVLDFWYKSRPMVELNFGFGYPNQFNFQEEFAPVGNVDVKLGKSEIDKFSKTNLELNERYLFVSYLNSDIQHQEIAPNEVKTKSYRFGFGSRDGVGYGSSGFWISPYVSQDFVWTKLDDFNDSLKPDSGGTKSNDYLILEDYWGTFRFGDKATYGVKAEIISMLQLNAYYETSVVYARHLFWYWAGSFAISQIGYSSLSYFTDQIVDSSPVIGPLVSIVLRAAYLYGYYLLREENMNWPFETQAPLRFETINIGVSLVF